MDIIIPKHLITNKLLTGLKQTDDDNFIAFGWGDENFYVNTPTWNDLTFGNAFRALFLKSSTLMHVTRYNQEQSNWISVSINNTELLKLNKYILATFKTNKNDDKLILNNKGYSNNDDFYKAKGSYSIFKTCNTWVNYGFIESDMKACYWTPFDYGLINKYKTAL